MSDDIKLPPLPIYMDSVTAEECYGSGQPAADLIRRMRNRLNVLASEGADMADQADAVALVAEADALLSGQPAANAAPSGNAGDTQDERWKQSAARDPLAYAAGYSDGTKNALDITAQAQPCDHVYEARPIDGSRRASAPFEAVCQKCGYRPAARAAKGQ